MKSSLEHPGWRPAWQAWGWQALPFATFLAALVFLRQQLLHELKMDVGTALDIGLGLGWFQDLVVVLTVAAITRALWAAVGLSSRVSLPVLLLLVWVACFANVAYFRFFGMRLDWWVVAMQWRDAGVVGDSSVQLGLTWPVVSSAGLGVLALALALAPRCATEPVGARDRTWWRRRPQALLRVLPLLLLSFVAWRAPRALGFQVGSHILDGNIVRTWLSTSGSASGSRGRADRNEADAAPRDPQAPSTLLARYRDLDNTAPAPDPTAVLEAPRDGKPAATRELDPNWPLSRELVADAPMTAALRRRFGLPEDGPIHVVVLFLESARAYEVFHPELGPEIYPRLNELLRTHALVFKQSYSSSFTAGQTVRGQFSTLCSMVPNMTGAAEYIAHTTLKVRCLQELMRDSGYETVWMNGYKAAYHNKQAFELLHGTHLFFDETAFRERGVTQRIGSWGLADGPLLQESVRLLQELSAAKTPLFVNLLTLSTHHPYHFLPEGGLSDALLAKLGDATYYRDYLSGLRYEDQAVAAFFEALFASPIADRTLVVMLGDHSVAVSPHLPLTPVQDEEMRFRILTAIVTKNMPAPEVIRSPVHQVDVAPTIARAVGLTGPMTWVGQGLLSGDGRPWVYARETTLSYRTATRGCYTPMGERSMRCYDLTERDPLFDNDLAQVPEDPATTDFMKQVVRAGAQAVVFNLMNPPENPR